MLNLLNFLKEINIIKNTGSKDLHFLCVPYMISCHVQSSHWRDY